MPNLAKPEGEWSLHLSILLNVVGGEKIDTALSLEESTTIKLYHIVKLAQSSGWWVNWLPSLDEKLKFKLYQGIYDENLENWHSSLSRNLESRKLTLLSQGIYDEKAVLSARLSAGLGEGQFQCNEQLCPQVVPYNFTRYIREGQVVIFKIWSVNLTPTISPGNICWEGWGVIFKHETEFEVCSCIIGRLKFLIQFVRTNQSFWSVSIYVWCFLSLGNISDPIAWKEKWWAQQRPKDRRTSPVRVNQYFWSSMYDAVLFFRNISDPLSKKEELFSEQQQPHERRRRVSSSVRTCLLSIFFISAHVWCSSVRANQPFLSVQFFSFYLFFTTKPAS